MPNSIKCGSSNSNEKGCRGNSVSKRKKAGRTVIYSYILQYVQYCTVHVSTVLLVVPLEYVLIAADRMREKYSTLREVN